MRHDSQYATIDRIKEAIVILEVQQPHFLDWIVFDTMFYKGRLINVYDIPKHAPYLFQDPILSSQEAQTMLDQIRREDYGASVILKKKRSKTSRTPFSEIK